MGSGNNGLNGRPYRTERKAMVQRVWDQVFKDGFGFIKAPPFSGKTAFMQQVLNHAEAQGWRALYFSCTYLKEFGMQLDDALRDCCGGTLAELMRGGKSCVAGSVRPHVLRLSSGATCFHAGSPS